MSDPLHKEKPDCTLDEVFKLLRHFDEKLTRHMDDEEGKYQALERKINKLIDMQKEQGDDIKSLSVLVQAFPKIDGEDIPDIRGHYHYHYNKIKDYHSVQARWNRLKDMVFEKMVSAFLIGFVIIIGFGLQTWFTRWLGIAH